MLSSEQKIDAIYNQNEKAMIEATVATNIFPKQAIEGFFKNRTVMITNDLLLSNQRNYFTFINSQDEEISGDSSNCDKSSDHASQETQDTNLETLSLESKLDMAKYFYFVNNKYISQIEAQSVSQRETAKLFNIPRTTFNDFLLRNHIYKKMASPFSDFDICYIKGQLIALCNSDMTISDTDAFRRFLTRFLKTKLFSQIAEKKLDQILKTQDCDEELLNASRFIKIAEYPDNDEVLTVGSQREWLSTFNRSSDILEKKYSEIVDDLAAKEGVSVSTATALNVKERIGGKFVAARLIEANRRDIGSNVVRNEDFLRNFILNKKYISKFKDFIFNCDEKGLQIGEKSKTGTVCIVLIQYRMSRDK